MARDSARVLHFWKCSALIRLAGGTKKKEKEHQTLLVGQKKGTNLLPPKRVQTVSHSRSSTINARANHTGEKKIQVTHLFFPLRPPFALLLSPLNFSSPHNSQHSPLSCLPRRLSFTLRLLSLASRQVRFLRNPSPWLTR